MPQGAPGYGGMPQGAPGHEGMPQGAPGYGGMPLATAYDLGTNGLELRWAMMAQVAEYSGMRYPMGALHKVPVVHVLMSATAVMLAHCHVSRNMNTVPLEAHAWGMMGRDGA